MGVDIEDTDAFIDSLRALPRETDWVEFKENNFSAETVGKYVSSLANSAILAERDEAYLIFGISDNDHAVVGTQVDIAGQTVGNEPFLLWLAKYLSPSIYAHHQSMYYNGRKVEVLCVKPPYQQPVRFKGQAYVRVASSLQALTNHPNLERSIWQITARFSFESSISEPNLTSAQLVKRYNYSKLLMMVGKDFRSEEGALDHLEQLGLIKFNLQKRFDVTALLGLSSSRRMNDISILRDKTVRVVVYSKTNKMEALSDTEGERGYIITFEDLMLFLMEKIPSEEVMRHGIRKKEFKIPQDTIREIVANAIVHQDFTAVGQRPVVEFFADKVKITNPGIPLVEPDRFIDTPSKSRNPEFARLMRAAGIVEQRGSGIDRAIREIERASLPPPLIQTSEGSTIVTIFMHKPFSQLAPDDRIRACYQHACLRFEESDPMNNQSLRQRFGLSDKQYPQVSTVIRDAIDAGRIKQLNEGQANKIARYVPYWA